MRKDGAKPRRGRVADEGSDAFFAYLSALSRAPRLEGSEERRLAREPESATHRFQTAVYAVPGTAREVARRWRLARSEGRATRRMSEHYGQRGASDDARLDACLAELERVLRARERLPDSSGAPRRATLDRRATRLLLEAELSQELVRHLHRWLRRRERVLRRSGADARRRGAAERVLGMSAQAFLGHMEEVERAYERMSTLRNRFALHNLRLVVAVAKDFQHLGIGLPDLVQEGNTGLLRAVERFDWRRGTSFASYAVWWIRHALVRSVQNHSRTVRVPSNQYDARRKYQRMRSQLEAKLGRMPTHPEIGDSLGVSAERIEELERFFVEPLSLDAEIASEGTGATTLLELLEDGAASDPTDVLDLVRLVGWIQHVLSELPERERRILCWRFGLDGQGECSLQDVGVRLGLSAERVRQLERRALDRLRRRAERSREH